MRAATVAGRHKAVERARRARDRAGEAVDLDPGSRAYRRDLKRAAQELQKVERWHSADLGCPSCRR